MTDKQKKEYVKRTILTQNKDRIQVVLKHYWAKPDILQAAKDIFKK